VTMKVIEVQIALGAYMGSWVKVIPDVIVQALVTVASCKCKVHEANDL
jgi:hypothetical protein